MQTMMLMQQARFRAKTAQGRGKVVREQAKTTNKHPLQTEKGNDAPQKEVRKVIADPKPGLTQRYHKSLIV